MFVTRLKPNWNPNRPASIIAALPSSLIPFNTLKTQISVPGPGVEVAARTRQQQFQP